MKEFHAMKHIISTVDELVDAFGGTGEFASWLDVGPSTVSNWKSFGHIPNGYHLKIFLEAYSRGLQLSSNVFGFEKWPPWLEKARSLARVEARA